MFATIPDPKYPAKLPPSDPRFSGARTPTSMIITVFFFNDAATTEIYTLSLHDALPIWQSVKNHQPRTWRGAYRTGRLRPSGRSEEHTSELQSHLNIVCRLLLEKQKGRGDDQTELQGEADQGGRDQVLAGW